MRPVMASIDWPGPRSSHGLTLTKIVALSNRGLLSQEPLHALDHRLGPL